MSKARPKLGCYLRVSTRDKQTTKSQRHSIRQWATTNRIPLDQIRWYEDKLSGKASTDRPALNKMLRAVERGSIDTVVVYRLSRLSRSTRSGLETLAMLAEHQIRVVSVTENIDFNGSMGRFLATLFLAISQFERETIVQNILDGLRACKARGQVLGRPVNHQRRERVQRLKADGRSVQDIADELGCSRQNVYRCLAGSQQRQAV